MIKRSRQKELDADPKTIQQLKFVGQSKILQIHEITELEKIKETRLKFSQGSVTVL